MKAVVLEIRDGYAAVLREDGVVEKLRRDCRVGETIELSEAGRVTRLPRAGRWVAAAAAALVIVSAGGGWGYNNAYAYSYVTLDANPSIEYTLNRKNRVLSVSALNEEGAALAEELSDLKNASLTDAVAAATDALYERDYLGENTENCLLLSVSSRGEAQQTALTEELDAYFAARTETEDDGLQVYVTSATRADARQAAAQGVSAGRYVVARDIAERDSGGPQDIVRMENETVGRLLEEKGVRTPPAESGTETPTEPRTGDRTDARPETAPAQDRTGAGEPTGEPAAAMAPDPSQAGPGDGGPQSAPAGRDVGEVPGGPVDGAGGGASGEPSR